MLTAPVFVIKGETALYLAGLRDGSGARVFPDIGFSGGAIWSIPVLASNSVGDRIV